MGHSNAGGSKGLGVFTDSASTVADLNKLLEILARFAYTRGGEMDELEAIPAPQLYPGLRFVDQATGDVYKYTESGWRPWDTEWETYTPATVTLIPGTAGTLVTKYRYVGGRVMVEIRCKFGSSGGTIAGMAKVALPVDRAPLAHPYEASPELGVYYQAAITRVHRVSVVADVGSTSVVRFGYGLPFGTSDVSTTIPADPIAENDTLHVLFTYDPA